MTNPKETEMNAWKTLALATAVAALAVPVANAKFDSSSPSKAKHAKIVHHKKVAPKIKTKTPRVLIIVAPYTVTGSMSTGDDCAISGNNCTDQQLCDMWGMNCDQVAASQPDVAATEEQTASS